MPGTSERAASRHNMTGQTGPRSPESGWPKRVCSRPDWQRQSFRLRPLRQGLTDLSALAGDHSAADAGCDRTAPVVLTTAGQHRVHRDTVGLQFIIDGSETNDAASPIRPKVTRVGVVTIFCPGLLAPLQTAPKGRLNVSPIAWVKLTCGDEPPCPTHQDPRASERRFLVQEPGVWSSHQTAPRS